MGKYCISNRVRFIESMEQREQDLNEQAARLSLREEYDVWEQQCDEYLQLLEEHSRIKRPRLSIGVQQSLIARIARLEGLKDSVRQRFVRVGAGYSADAGLRWREIDTAFASRILTGAVINSKHIEPRQFLEDARDIVLDRVQNVMKKHDNIKLNTVFNDEFVAGDKRANKSINTRNFELFHSSNLQEWYDLRVIESILASLDEFQERDSGWALSRIFNLTININKYNPLHAGCNNQLPQEIKMKKAVINVQSMDNACFAWSVVAALYPAERHVERESSYPHYTSVLNLQGIKFPVLLKDIDVFERLNDISINVYSIEKKMEEKKIKIVILPIRLTNDRKNKHVNLLYTPDKRNDNMGHFTWIKNLSRLVGSQVNKHNTKILLRSVSTIK